MRFLCVPSVALLGILYGCGGGEGNPGDGGPPEDSAADASSTPALDFAAPVTLPVGTDARTITAGDWNGDGHIDLAVAGFQEIVVLLGAGDGSFSESARLTAVYAGFALASADLDGDGHPDLVTAGAGIGVFLGQGDGKFVEGVAYPAFGAAEIDFADFDADGFIDVLTGDSYNNGTSVWVLLGRGDGTLEEAVGYDVGMVGANAPVPGAVAAVDFDGDGHTDALAANYRDGRIVWLPGDGTGHLGEAQTLAHAEARTALDATDVNGDGTLDLVVSGLQGLDVLLGDGHGGFEVVHRAGPASGGVGGLVDLDGDGHLDIVSAGFFGPTISFGRGDGTFSAPLEVDVDERVRGVVAADLNGNGLLDLAFVSDEAEAVVILLRQ